MSLRPSDISKRKGDRPSSDRNEHPISSRHQKAVLDEVLQELTSMSDNDLLEALVSSTDVADIHTSEEVVSGDLMSANEETNEVTPTKVNRNDITPETSITIDAEVNHLIDEMMLDAEVNDALESISEEELNSTTDSSEELSTPLNQESEDNSAELSVSGIIKDDTILSLMHWGLINMSHVFEAIQKKDPSRSLWRVVAEVDGVEAEAIYAAVAQIEGYERYPYLDAAPTREFAEELQVMLSTEQIVGLIDAGILPVDMEPEPEFGQYRVILVSPDPTCESVQQAVSQFSTIYRLQYAPEDEVKRRMDEVLLWLGDESRFGVPSTDVSEGDVEPLEQDVDGDLPFEATEADPLTLELAASIEEQLVVDSLDDSVIIDDVESGMEEIGPEAVLEIEDESGTGSEITPTESSETVIVNAEETPIDALIARDRVIRSLVRSERISEELVAMAAERHRNAGSGDALWRTLADQSGVDREIVYEEAARVYAFNREEISPGRPDFDFVRLTMETIADDHREEMLDLLVLPFEHALDFENGSGRMIFVTPDPTRPDINRLLHNLDLGRFELRYASESAIEDLLEELFPRKNEFLEKIEDDTLAFDLGTSYEEAEGELLDEDALEAEIGRSKLINLFEAALVEATRLGVSDIHIFPNPQRQVEIHFRQDGRLRKWHTEDKVHPEAFLSVVKDNSTNVDRFERDAAQDGFIQRQIDDALIRFRVSILPIASANQEIRAESIVIRVLDDRKVLTDLRKLGMLDVALERFDKAIRQPHGMVILTGPTGSGKSTTLVAALYQVVSAEVNVLTVEDPVEYIINGVRQIKLNNKLDLEGALRAILRHDPDIVMVGEMRDKHTAELAIKLANTGHLTFSTLHTNDAPAAVSRLYKMGVEPFLIAYAINLVVAQRLIRGVCPDCKVVDDHPDRVLMKSLGWTDEEIDSTTVYKANRGSTCVTCSGSGYKGRRAVCETLYFSDPIRHMIAASAEAIDEDAIRDLAVKEGMLTLIDSARVLVEMGATTVEEMLRVTGSE